VVREYLAGVTEMVAGSGVFAVLAHLDYPVRSWPDGPFDPAEFEDEFRTALRATARSGRPWSSTPWPTPTVSVPAADRTTSGDA
jgi:hypothetical protein